MAESFLVSRCSDSAGWRPLDSSPETWFIGRLHFTLLRYAPGAVSAEVLF